MPAKARLSGKESIKHEFARLGLDKTGWYIDCTGGGRFRGEYGDNLAVLRRSFQAHLRTSQCHCPPHQGECCE